MGIGAGLVASLLWACANVCVQRASLALGSMRALLWGQLVGAVALGLGMTLLPGAGGPVPWLWLLLGGLGSALGYVGLFQAFAAGSVTALTPVIATWSLVSAGIGFGVFHEPLQPVRLVGAVLVVSGAAGLARGEGDGVRPTRAALVWALASALGFGLMVAAQRPVGDVFGPATTILLLWGTQWVLLVPFALRTPAMLTPPPRPVWPWLVGVGLLEGGGFLALNLGTRVAPVSVVAPAAGLPVLFTLIAARVWLGERISARQVLLAALVCAGVGLLGAS